MPSSSRKKPQRGGGRPTEPASRPRPADERGAVRALLERLGADVRALADRVARQEHAHDAVLQAIHAVHEAIHARGDEVLDEVHALRTAAEPAALGAAVNADAPTAARHAGYREVVGRVRGLVRRLLPRGARVLVVSRGDDDLLRLSGRRAGHFPQDEAGDYAGHHPGDDRAALAHLRDLAAAGWQYLVIPEPSFWWLDHYAALRAHLERSCATIHRDVDTCGIWALDRPGPWLVLADRVDEFHRREGRFPAILDWETGRGLAAVFPECAVFGPLDAGLDALPYIDESIDLVAVPVGDAARLAEARRVASHAVIVSGPGDAIVVEPRSAARLPGGRR